MHTGHDVARCHKNSDFSKSPNISFKEMQDKYMQEWADEETPNE